MIFPLYANSAPRGSADLVRYFSSLCWWSSSNRYKFICACIVTAFPSCCGITLYLSDYKHVYVMLCFVLCFMGFYYCPDGAFICFSPCYSSDILSMATIVIRFHGGYLTSNVSILACIYALSSSHWSTSFIMCVIIFITEELS